MIHRCTVPLLAAGLFLQLAGCASPDFSVSTTFDPLTRFPAQSSYAWDDAANSLPADPRLQPLDLGPLIKEAADAEFAARGYRPATSGSPPYRLSYELTVHNWIGPDSSKSIGSLSLLLIEEASKRRVWMGFGRAEVHVGLSVEERRKRLREALKRMLASFPPSQR